MANQHTDSRNLPLARGAPAIDTSTVIILPRMGPSLPLQTAAQYRIRVVFKELDDSVVNDIPSRSLT